MPGEVISAAQPDGQGEALSLSLTVGAGDGPEDGPSVGGGICQKGQSTAGTGGGHGLAEAAMASPGQAACCAALGRPGAAVMGKGQAQHPLSLSQGMQARQAGAGGSGARLSPCDCLSQGTGGQVMKNHGPGLSSALGKLGI